MHTYITSLIKTSEKEKTHLVNTFFYFDNFENEI